MMVFNSHSLIKEVLDFYFWENNPQNWTTERLVVIPPSFIRHNRISSLLSAFGLDCTPSDFYFGIFWEFQPENERKQAILCLDYFVQENRIEMEGRNLGEVYVRVAWQGIWNHLIALAQFRNNITKWNEGGMSVVVFMDAFSRFGINVNSVDEKMELCIQLLAGMLNTPNFSIDEAVLVRDFGFPPENLSVVDLNWESR